MSRGDQQHPAPGLQCGTNDAEAVAGQGYAERIAGVILEHMFDSLEWDASQLDHWMGSAPTLTGMGPGWDDAERSALVALLRARPDRLTWPQIATEVADRGSALDLWHNHFPVDLFGGDEATPALVEAGRDIAEWREAGLGFLTFMDAGYPAKLREIHELPPVLFHRGTLVSSDPGVSVVGSLAASPRGLQIARTIAADLVGRGLSVISGLAKGIDAAAHITALDADSSTSSTAWATASPWTRSRRSAAVDSPHSR